MTEPDVTFTDYAIALECAVFCALALRRPAARVSLRRWWVAFFASIGFAALVGGTMHGFFPDDASTGGTLLWLATLLTLGVTSVAAWSLGSHLALPDAGARWVRRAAIGLFVAYSAAVLFVSRLFLVAIIMYLPATLFLLGAMIARYRRSPGRDVAMGVAGLVLTFVAAAIQQARIGVHPVYFDHNALYHVLQGIALLLIFIAARGTSREAA